MANEPKVPDSYSEPVKRPSSAWYLVPILFGIIGGLVMFLVLKDQNRRMAKKGLVVGIIFTVIGFVVGVIIGLLEVLMFSPLR